MPTRVRVVVLAATLALSGCAASATTSTNSADRTFLQDMVSHHRRAIEVGRLAVTHGVDPRVVAFGRRIVAEQTPELNRMVAEAKARRVHLDAAAGATMARNRITDTQVQTLRALPGPEFDHRFLALSASSEQGAAAMARTEIAHGENSAARTLAKAIAGAPHSEIPQLQALLRTLS